MQIIPMFLKELEQEAQATRKMLQRVPNDKFSWQPHPKSMTISRLVNHIVELPSWISMAITTSELDFAVVPYNTDGLNTIEEVLELLEENVADARAKLEATNEDVLAKNWTLRNGDQIYSIRTKAEVIRVSFNQTAHHRAQLGVFLRLLDIPIPGSYGPSADEPQFKLIEQD
ncbi:DinB family protein [Mucilaginibacter sp.]